MHGGDNDIRITLNDLPFRCSIFFLSSLQIKAINSQLICWSSAHAQLRIVYNSVRRETISYQFIIIYIQSRVCVLYYVYIYTCTNCKENRIRNAMRLLRYYTIS